LPGLGAAIAEIEAFRNLDRGDACGIFADGRGDSAAFAFRWLVSMIGHP
jgi:hypothetical protein